MAKAILFLFTLFALSSGFRAEAAVPEHRAKAAAHTHKRVIRGGKGSGPQWMGGGDYQKYPSYYDCAANMLNTIYGCYE